MSCIYFHSPSGAAELRGSERAHMGIMASDALVHGLGLWDRGFLLDELHAHRMAIVGMIENPPDYLSSDYLRSHPQSLETALAVMSDLQLLTPGGAVSAFALGLNTLIAGGSDPVILAARLHGQCEIHAWVKGPNRAWLADIIDRGRATGIYRAEQGWGGVAAFLRSDDSWPVVTSFSVCDGFPNAGVAIDAGLWTATAGEDGEPNTDAWYELPEARQWHLCLDALGREPLLEMRPDNWSTYHFGLPLTARHIAEMASKRTAAAAR